MTPMPSQMLNARVRYQSQYSAVVSVPILPYPPAKFQLPSRKLSKQMMARYFDFATPTYRFFHRPTVEQWAEKLLGHSNKGQVSPVDKVKYAAVYLVWAQAIEYEDKAEQSPGRR